MVVVSPKTKSSRLFQRKKSVDSGRDCHQVAFKIPTAVSSSSVLCPWQMEKQCWWLEMIISYLVKNDDDDDVLGPNSVKIVVLVVELLVWHPSMRFVCVCMACRNLLVPSTRYGAKVEPLRDEAILQSAAARARRSSRWKSSLGESLVQADLQAAKPKVSFVRFKFIAVASSPGLEFHCHESLIGSNDLP